ncbi:hypothetical protein N7520_006339 [Penicillium odoratum]|uniref:uncharacterized protein n=1 Tax=Penicillium odoratum TaxID=1167516 RepID=UPI002547D6E7|nr:uncharacterized protein N7520_006339 [Penicillium odoratum]KAJ5759183.1 hypothetical protein N7520_006339 [Penicillium odoratum]
MAMTTILAGTIAHLSHFQFRGELVVDGQISVLRGVCASQSSFYRGLDAEGELPLKVQPPYRPCKLDPV